LGMFSSSNQFTHLLAAWQKDRKQVLSRSLRPKVFWHQKSALPTAAQGKSS
jgi:hypothetical protein